MSQQNNFLESDSIKLDLYNAIEKIFPDFNYDEKIYLLIKKLQESAFSEGMNAIKKIEKQDGLELLQGSSNELMMKLKSFGLSEMLTERICSEYSADFIEEKIALVENSANYKNGRIVAFAPYFLSALRNNYKPHKNS